MGPSRHANRSVARAVSAAGLILDLDACMLARESGEAITPHTRRVRALARVRHPSRTGRQLGRTLLDALASQRASEPFDASVDGSRSKRNCAARSSPTLRNRGSSSTVPGEGYRVRLAAEDYDGRRAGVRSRACRP